MSAIPSELSSSLQQIGLSSCLDMKRYVDWSASARNIMPRLLGHSEECKAKGIGLPSPCTMTPVTGGEIRLLTWSCGGAGGKGLSAVKATPLLMF